MDLKYLKNMLNEVNEGHNFAYCNILTNASAKQECWYLRKDYKYDFHKVADELSSKGYICEFAEDDGKGISAYYKVSGWM